MPALPSSTIFLPMAHLGVRSDAVAITVNGDSRDIPAGSVLFMDHMNHVMVERNREILRDRDSYGHIELTGGDTIEIVHFVGGG